MWIDLKLQVIGEGEFGLVYKAQYMTDEGALRMVAVKVLNDVEEEQTKDFVQVKFRDLFYFLFLAKIFG